MATMDGEQWRELHQAIVAGDLHLVRDLLQVPADGQCFSYDGESALSKALSCQQYDIASLLIHKGAKLHDLEEVYDVEVDLTRLNFLLLEYNKKPRKSCIFQLICCSRSPQGLDGEYLYAVMTMYEHFYKSEITKSLMMVLESKPLDIVFDFESELVNRMYRLYLGESEIFGLTTINYKQIFIGAKKLLSINSEERKEVYAVVAEELCHLAMVILFDNYAKPYTKDNSELRLEFQNITEAVHNLLKVASVKSVIKDVFENYADHFWESELIARVPVIIGKYGEECGRMILIEYPELLRLLHFYEKNVLPHCKLYTDPSLNSKAHRMMEQIVKKYDFLSIEERLVQPVNENIPSFMSYLTNIDGISVINTNCPKLCILQIYHELKREFNDLLEKKCLFFNRKIFENKIDEILNALKGSIWKYLILMLDEKELNLRRYKVEFIDPFNEFITKGMKFIVITANQYLGQNFQSKFVNYNWNDLTNGYKKTLCTIKYRLKGEVKSIFVPNEHFPKYFSEEDFIRIISGEIFEVGDGTGLYSQGYIPEIYVKREFMAMAVDKAIFSNLPDDVNIFIPDLKMSDFHELSINESQVQCLRGSDDRIQREKSIFIVDEETLIHFEAFRRKISWKKHIWLHYDKVVKELYLRDADSSDDFLKQYMKPIFKEKDMINLMRRNRITIISDNAGCGKSTVVSSLIRGIKEEEDYSSLIWRIDLNKFARGDSDPVSLAHIEENSEGSEEVLDHFLFMIGLQNGLGKLFFKKRSREHGCFIFFDGFDELPLKYKDKTKKLLSILKEETLVNLIITTRKHHQEELEQIMQTCSHQLVPFSSEAKVMYLEKLWRWKLKFPSGIRALTSKKYDIKLPEKIKMIISMLKKDRGRQERDYQNLRDALEKIDLHESLPVIRSKIDELDFTKVAENILYKTSLDENISSFMGNPLHLYMIGIFHHNSNFEVESQINFFHLYSHFVEQKIQIYLEEKQLVLHEGDQVRKDAFKIHIELACQLFDKIEICPASKMKVTDSKLCSSLGIVFIQGGTVHFLHQTFAEFFIAKSLIQDIDKELFIKMLFKDKFNVVRRFVASGLEKDNFESVTEEFFQDVGFLITVMQGIFDIHPFSLNIWEPRNTDFDKFCVFKIVRKLLESFEDKVKVENKAVLVKKFLKAIDSLVKKCIKVEKNCGLELYRQGIGCCLTVSMLKSLLTKNFRVYSTVLFGFVRYSENHNDVLDVMKECISIKSGGNRCIIFKRENRGIVRGKTEAECLLELLNYKDLCRNGLVYHALNNERAEIIASVFKFFRDVLGQEQFIEEIVNTEECSVHMKNTIENQHPNRIYRLFKEFFFSVFSEDEMKIIFEKDRETRVCAIGISFRSDDFDELSNLFSDCFGNEDLKELLLSEYSGGYNAIHELTCYCPSRIFMKNLILIKEKLGDDEKFKQLLESKDDFHSNIFHLTLQRDISFEVLLKFCCSHLEEDQIKHLFLEYNEYGNNVMQSLVRKSSSEELKYHFNLIEELLGEERFKELLMSKNQCCQNIFHLAVMKYKSIVDLLLFCIRHLEKEVIKEMILGSDVNGCNVMHLSFEHSDSQVLPKTLDLVKKIFSDDANFKKLLFSRSNLGETIFHFVVRNKNEVDLSILKSHLSKNDIIETLTIVKEDGCTCLHIAADYVRNLPGFLNFVYDLFDIDRFERYVMAVDKLRNTFLHYLDQDSLSIINASKFVFDTLKRTLPDQKYNELLRVRNEKGQTFLQIKSILRDEIKRFCEGILEKDLFEELLASEANEGNASVSSE